MLLKIIAFLKGYIKVKAIGGFPERFLNLCAAANRDIWQVKTENDGISFCADIREYKTSVCRPGGRGLKMRVAENTACLFLFLNTEREKVLPWGRCALCC